MKSIWNNTAYRILIIITGVLLLLFLAVLIFSDPILNSLVKDKLLAKANAGKNTTLHIDDMSYHLFSNSVVTSGIKLSYKDSSSGGTSVYDVKIPSFEISGINWFNIIFSSGLSLGTAVISRPVLQIKSDQSRKSQGEENKQGKEKQRYSPLFNKSFISSLPSRINPFNLSKLEIRSGKLFRISKTEDETTKDTISSFNLSISGIKLDSTVSDSSLKYIIAGDFGFDAEKIKRLYVRGGNEIKIDSIYVSGEDSLLNIKNFSYQPFLSRQDYFARKKYRTDRRIFKFTNLELKRIDFSSVVHKRIFNISKAAVNDFYIDILTDKRLPLNPSCCPKMPNEILRDMTFGLDIKKITLTNGELYVKSLQDNSDTAAVIPFTGIHAEFSDISNLKGSDTEAKINAEANMFDAGRLTMHMKMNLISAKLNFSNYGKLDSMNVEAMNQWLKIENLVRLTNGQVSEISYSTDTENGLALAKVTPVYRNLKVEMLTKEKNKKSIKTFLANAIKMRDANPKDGKLKVGSLYYKRKSDDAFLDVLWVPLREALGKVAGY